MKPIKKLCWLILAAASITGSSCSKDNDNEPGLKSALIGTWQGEKESFYDGYHDDAYCLWGYTYVFNSDGTCEEIVRIIESHNYYGWGGENSFTWEATNSTLTLTDSSSEPYVVKSIWQYSISSDKKTLTLANPSYIYVDGTEHLNKDYEIVLYRQEL